MNLDQMNELLAATTIQFRKGESIVERTTEGLEVTGVFAMPHESEADGLLKIDVHFIIIGVDAAKAEAHRDQLISLLNSHPDPERLAAGPSYIEVGAVVGDQGAALQLFALGQALDLWKVVTPATLGLNGPLADDAAGRGLVMITGYQGEG